MNLLRSKHLRSHPLAWLLNRTLFRLREDCCDDIVVVNNVESRESYCATLVRVVEWCSVRTRTLEHAAAQLGPLANRIKRVMDPLVCRSVAVSRLGWALAIVIGLVILPGLGIQLSRAGSPGPIESGESQKDERDLEGSFKAGDIGGRVLDEKGNAVNATVWMRRGQAGSLLFESTTTSSDGHFRFSNVEPGIITFTAITDDHSFAGTHRSIQKDQIERNLNLIVTPPNSLALNIRDAEGNPVADAELARISWTQPAKSSFWLPLEVLDHSQIGRPKSNKEGLLTIPGIPAKAKCDIVVKHASFARALVEQVSVADNPISLTLEAGVPIVIRAIDAETGRPASDATVNIDGFPKSISVYSERVDEEGEFHICLPVSPDHATISVGHPELAANKWVWAREGGVSGDLEFKLYRRGKLRGRVVNSKSGEPCEGVPISVVNDRQEIARYLSRADGYFEISAPSGRFTYSVGTGNGFYAASQTESPIQIEPGETTDVGEVLAKQLPKLGGVVLMPSGEPAAGALVVCDELGVDAQLTDERGHFEFQIIQKNHGVHIRASHMTEKLSNGKALAMDEIMQGPEVQIRLQPETEIRGSVVDSSGKPLTGIRVSLVTGVSFGPEAKQGTLSQYSQCDIAVTDVKGMYRFIGLARDCDYRTVVGPSLSTESVRSPRIQPDQALVQLEALRVADLKTTDAETQQQAAPAILCKEWINSPALQLESLRGKVVLLDFWATWCGPCVAELSHVQTAHDLFKDKGLVVIALHHNSVPAAEVRAFVDGRGLTFPVGLDNDDGATCGNYNVNVFPTKILIGRDGKIVPMHFTRAHLLMTLRRTMLYGDY